MYKICKRGLDIFLSLSALLLGSPIFAVIIPLLKFTGEGEIFFTQQRIGKRHKYFGLFKFATMLKDSPKSGTVTAKNDPRILPLGRFLRITKINELPQLFNVLKGDMSLVGFRPLTEEAFQYYPEDIKKYLLEMRPGLTGLGSIVFRNEEEILFESEKDRMSCYREDIAPLKGALEKWYYERRNFLTDIKLITATVLVVFFPKSKFYTHWFPIEDLLKQSTLNRYF